MNMMSIALASLGLGLHHQSFLLGGEMTSLQRTKAPSQKAFIAQVIKEVIQSTMPQSKGRVPLTVETLFEITQHA